MNAHAGKDNVQIAVAINIEQAQINRIALRADVMPLLGNLCHNRLRQQAQHRDTQADLARFQLSSRHTGFHTSGKPVQISRQVANF